MLFFFLFFFNDTATTEIYTLSLHDALPICAALSSLRLCCCWRSLSFRASISACFLSISACRRSRASFRSWLYFLPTSVSFHTVSGSKTPTFGGSAGCAGRDVAPKVRSRQTKGPHNHRGIEGLLDSRQRAMTIPQRSGAYMGGGPPRKWCRC